MTIEVKEYHQKREISCNSCFTVLRYSYQDVEYTRDRDSLEGFLIKKGYPYIVCPVCHREVILK